MAIEKEPSIYSDRGAIGSADELDQYGVWVKSEPQDLAESGAELPDFEPEMGETLSFDSGAMEDEGLSLIDLPELPDPSEFEKPASGDFAVSDSDFSADLEPLENEVLAVPEHGFSVEPEPFETASPDADVVGQAASDDLSTRLLMKIVEELSSIREELSTLKKEFAGIRIGGGEKRDGFFAEEEDDKIALTGDEMDTILNTAALENLDSLEVPGEDIDLGGGEVLPLEPEASIEESSIEESSIDEEASIEEPSIEEASIEEPDGGDEEIEIDLDDLGINLNDIEDEAKGEAAPTPADTDIPLAEMVDELDVSLDSDFDIDVPVDEVPDFEKISTSVEALDAVELSAFEEPSVSEEPAAEIETLAESSLDDGIIGLEALDENDGLHNIRLEGAEPLTAPPDNISYLEEDPHAFSAEDLSPLETPEEQSFDLSVTESSIGDGLVMADGFEAEASILEEPILEDIVLDDDITIALEEEEQHENLTEGGAVLEDIEELAVIPEALENNTEEIIVPFDDDIDPLAGEGLSANASLVEAPLEPDVSAAALEDVPSGFKKELRNVLSYMDRLLESLPEEKIEEFAKSEYFASYKKLFKELGLV